MDSLKGRMHAETLQHLQTAMKLGAKPYYEYESVEMVRKVQDGASAHFGEDFKDFVGESVEVRIPSKDVPSKFLCMTLHTLRKKVLQSIHLDPKIPIMVLPGTIWSSQVLNRVLYL